MDICSVFQISVQRKNIVHQIERKQRDVFSFSFAPQEFLPGDEQVLQGYDMIEAMKMTPVLSLINASVILRIKEAFSIWCNGIVPHMPRTARYTTGARIENHFLDLLELIYKAYYANLEIKSGKIVEAIEKVIIEKNLTSVFKIETARGYFAFLWKSFVAGFCNSKYNTQKNKIFFLLFPPPLF